jgi:AcrR family transcriptional regulator
MESTEQSSDESRSEAGLARRRLLDVAEALFMERGYSAVSLRDIADAFGIKQASLYYHFPGGKEELYVAVAQRAFARHHAGILEALEGEEEIGAKLTAVANWFTTQPRMCLMGMMHADLPALHAEANEAVTAAAAQGLFQPIAHAFAGAQDRSEVRPVSPFLLAGAFLALLDGATISQDLAGSGGREQVIHGLIDLLLHGASAPSTEAPASPTDAA